MSAERRKVHRKDLPSASLKRLLKDGASAQIKDARVSAKAVVEARRALRKKLDALRKAAEKRLEIAGKKTLNLGALVDLLGEQLGVSAEIAQGRRGRSTLSSAGVRRVFAGKKKGGIRLTKEAAKGLVGAAEAMVLKMGASASLMASSGKRKTLSSNDIIVGQACR